MLKKNNSDLLIIIDDILPHNLSSFRNVEIKEYIKKYSNIVFINISKAPLNENNFIKEVIDNNIKYFQTDFNDEELENIKNYINTFDKKVAMITFLNNIYGYDGEVLKFLEENNITFSFTLYPGGGFFINDETKEKLKRIFASPKFYKVIVTQKKSLEYLVTNNLCPINNIKFIYGLPISPSMLKLKLKRREYNNDAINICFVAYKYCPEGKDKGYDIFINLVKEFKNDNHYRFHVVGNFSAEDIDISDIKDKIKFYGILKTEKFIDFYQDKDILISPTRSNILYPGAFDGFPTGASVDAMLNKILLITSDPLDNNIYFKNEKDIIIIDNKVENLKLKVEEVTQNPIKIRIIANQGYKKANNLFSYRKQIISRLKIIEEMREKNE